jgi:hypothetical protein
MEWRRVVSEADVEELLSAFGGFHDSCLREVHLWTEQYVSEDLSMTCPSHLDSHVRMLFQRQARPCCGLELMFHEVLGFRVAPSPENYDSTIFDATLTLTDGVFYWSDGFGATPDEDTTWVAAKELWWRDASEWMGPALRYGPLEQGHGRGSDRRAAPLSSRPGIGFQGPLAR